MEGLSFLVGKSFWKCVPAVRVQFLLLSLRGRKTVSTAVLTWNYYNFCWIIKATVYFEDKTAEVRVLVIIITKLFYCTLPLGNNFIAKIIPLLHYVCVLRLQNDSCLEITSQREKLNATWGGKNHAWLRLFMFHILLLFLKKTLLWFWLRWSYRKKDVDSYVLHWP